jgi:hypothetical protein
MEALAQTSSHLSIEFDRIDASDYVTFEAGLNELNDIPSTEGLKKVRKMDLTVRKS